MAQEQTGRYKSLISNTLLFGLSTFGSKMLVVLLMPIYTRHLSPEAYGMVDIISGTCNLIVPIISLCVHEAVIRFGLEKEVRRRDVFTTALLTVMAGYLLLFCFWPLLRRVELIAGYLPLIYGYVITSALRSVVTHFVRSGGFVRLFALDGIFTTALTVTLKVAFIAGAKMGVVGDGLATVIADGCSALLLILLLRLHRFFRPGKFKDSVAREMLTYSIPLVPTAIFWWITNLSDRYFVTYMVGLDVNGLYNVAYKIPMMITLVSAIFIQAWQISAFGEKDKQQSARFFSTVFRCYYTLVFSAASGILLLIKPITRILVSKDFFMSWRYVPFLILAVSFSCLVTFLGTVYNTAKKNMMVTITTFVGALLNILLNWLLIPKFGANGAAFATFFSFLVVFLIRAVDCRRYISIAMQPLRIALNLILLLLQCWVALTEPAYWVWWEIGILVLILGCNVGNLLFLLRMTKSLLPRRSK